MKKVFTKMSCIALGFMLFSSSMKAEEVKDYTYLLKNPSFEHYMDEDLSPLDVTNPDGPGIISGAYRDTPPGWIDTLVLLPEGATQRSYGVNRNALNKDGLNVMWLSTDPFPVNYAIYQEVVVGNGPNQLPAGEYKFSCKLSVFKPRLTDQRFYVETWRNGEIVKCSVQYPSTEDVYDLPEAQFYANEERSFAGWELTGGVGDSDSMLKPMSIVLTVEDGDVLHIGIKSSNDGVSFAHLSKQSGFFKVDDFRITTNTVPPVDPNDYTYMIKNPSFEEDAEGELSMLHNLVVRSDYYGWKYNIVNYDPEIAFTGTSWGCNADGNNVDRVRLAWFSSGDAPFVEFLEVYQEINNLPAGTYEVSCRMWTPRLTTQRLFAKTSDANNKAVLWGSGGDTDYYLNAEDLAKTEDLTYAECYVAGENGDNLQSGRYLKPMSLEIDVAAGETLRLGIKSSNKNDMNMPSAKSEGWLKWDDFRLKLKSETSNPAIKGDVPFSVKSQKGSFVLNLNEAAQVKVISLAGQTVYNQNVNNNETVVELPQGVYIVLVSVNGITKAEKVIVK